MAVAGCLGLRQRSRGSGSSRPIPTCVGSGLATRISQHLVDWALAQGCATVALDASSRGRPVYARLGFRRSAATAELCGRRHPVAATAREPSRAAAADLDEIVAFDAGVFGGDRAAAPSRARRRSGRGAGRDADGRRDDRRLPLARGQLIGPAAADDEAAAGALVRAALDDRRSTSASSCRTGARISGRCSRSGSSSSGGSCTCASASSTSRRPAAGSCRAAELRDRMTLVDSLRRRSAGTTMGETRAAEALDPRDAIAGVSVALVVVPQSLAYAQLAGLPAGARPVRGLGAAAGGRAVRLVALPPARPDSGQRPADVRRALPARGHRAARATSSSPPCSR